MLALIIGVPLFTVSLLRSQLLAGTAKKIQNERLHGQQLETEKDISGVKAIKVLGDKTLDARDIRLKVASGTKDRYKFEKMSTKDSLEVSWVGDTLVFRYFVNDSIATSEGGFVNHSPIYITVHLKAPVPLYASRASITYLLGERDPADYAALPGKAALVNQQIYLENKALLSMGQQVNNSKNARKKTDTLPVNFIYRMQISAENSAVYFDGQQHFGYLNLEMRRGGGLYLNTPFTADKIEGSLSGSTYLQGDYGDIKSLLPILHQ